MIQALILVVIIVTSLSILIFGSIFGLTSGSSGSPKPVDVCAGVRNTGYTFLDRQQLDGAIDEWIQNPRQATETYGDINTWDVTNVIDMSSLFNGIGLFNSDIGCWDVSNVQFMDSMFKNATSFDKDISTKQVTVEGTTYIAWDVSNVQYMSNMFDNATSFNQNIGNWNVSSVTDMRNMFQGASNFDKNLSNWDPNVSNSSNFRNMFNGAFVNTQTNGDWTGGSLNFRNALEGATGDTINGFYSNGLDYVDSQVTPPGAFPILRS